MTAAKHLLPFFYILLLSCCIYGKGCSGTYYISGTAYGKDNSPVKTSSLVVKVGSTTTIAQTDTLGHFEIAIAWSSACPSKLSKMELKKENERLNPAYILISYHGIEINIENKWEKFAQCIPASRQSVTWQKDLTFL